MPPRRAKPSRTPASPGRPRDPVNTQRRRGEILRCATQHFARVGFPNADLDAVAAELGCAKGTLYRYFKTKRDLFGEAADAIMAELLARIENAPSDDPIDRIEHAIRAFLGYFDEFPEHAELLIQERAEFRDRRRPTYYRYRRANAKLWESLYRRLMDEGRVRRMPPGRPSAVIGDLLYGVIFTNYFSGRRVGFATRADDVIDVVFRGILTPEELARRELRRAEPGRSRREGAGAHGGKRGRRSER